MHTLCAVGHNGYMYIYILAKVGDIKVLELGSMCPKLLGVCYFKSLRV